MKVYSSDCCKQDGSVAEQRASAHHDRVGHSSVQAWSAGPLFPAVIAVVESYVEPLSEREWNDAGYAEYLAGFYLQPLDARLRYRAFELTMPGRDPMIYASREDAEEAARGLLAYDAWVKGVALAHAFLADTEVA